MIICSLSFKTIPSIEKFESEICQVIDLDLEKYVNQKSEIEFQVMEDDFPGSTNRYLTKPPHNCGDHKFPADKPKVIELLKTQIYDKIEELLDGSNSNSHTYDKPKFFIGGYNKDISDIYYFNGIKQEYIYRI